MELLVAVIALLVAIYTMMARERQLEMDYLIGGCEWFAFLLGLLPIIYLEYYGFFAAHGLALDERLWPSGITPTNIKPPLLLFFVTLWCLAVRRARLSKRRIKKFAALCRELFWAGSETALVALMQRNLKELFQIYRADFALANLHRRLSSRVTFSFESFVLRANRDSSRHVLEDRLPLWIVRGLVRLLPSSSSEQETAAELIQTVLSTRQFVRTISRVRPYLGIEIVRELPRESDQTEFMSKLLTELMAGEDSVFFWEIENSQNMTKGRRYAILPANRLIYFLLKDANVAHRLGVYKPIGDLALRELERLAISSESDPYNQPADESWEQQKWRLPLFATIHFFDLMVLEALYQGIEWHMWLYYFPLIVRRMVQNYAPPDAIGDVENTFPVPYSHLIYEAVSTIRDWVKASEEVPAGQRNVTLRSNLVEGDNANIPHSAIVALAECSRHVLVSDAFTHDFKSQIMNGTFELYFTLRRSERLSGYADVLTSALRRGGVVHSTDATYLASLHGCFVRRQHELNIVHDRQQVLDLGRAIGLAGAAE